MKKTLIVIALLAAAGFAVWFFAAPHTDPERIAAWLRDIAGRWWTAPAFIALYVLLAVLFIPTQALSIAAVVLWGWQKGGAMEMAAATLGAMLPYALARGAMRERVERALARYPVGEQLLREEAASILLILRLFPIVPYTALNYLAGLSTVKPLRYAAISLIGMTPSVFIFAYFVDALIQGATAPRAVTGRIFIAGALLALLVVAARVAARRFQRASPPLPHPYNARPMPLGTIRALALLHRTFRKHPFTQRLHILGRFFTAPFLRTIEVIPQGARVLDIGAGHGTYPRLIAEERAAEVIAVEPDLRKTLIAFRHPRVRFVAGFDDCIRGEFDVIVIYDVIYRLDAANRDALFARVFERVKPGGLFVLKDLDPAKRLKWLWNRMQETISDAVFHFTIGSGFFIDTRESMRERMERAGFTDFRWKHVDFGYPHAHVLYTARKPA